MPQQLVIACACGWGVSDFEIWRNKGRDVQRMILDRAIGQQGRTSDEPPDGSSSPATTQNPNLGE
jgi:hypothetical protein